MENKTLTGVAIAILAVLVVIAGALVLSPKTVTQFGAASPNGAISINVNGSPISNSVPSSPVVYGQTSSPQELRFGASSGTESASFTGMTLSTATSSAVISTGTLTLGANSLWSVTSTRSSVTSTVAFGAGQANTCLFVKGPTSTLWGQVLGANFVWSTSPCN
ncbi:MAG: hypothetical protein WC776_04870 [Patescibacteria group bacterium]|jgi:hypothetical protein